MYGLVVECKTPQGIEFVHTTDTGADIRANEDTVIPVRGRKLVETGLYIKLPHGYGAEVRPRSGLAHKFGVTVLNSPGTIDNGYRGEVRVNLINLGDKPFHIKKGDRIAQLVFAQVPRIILVNVDEISENTERGTSGHGSSGVE